MASSAPIIYLRDTKTGADVNAIAGNDANSGLTDALAKQNYVGGMLGSVFDSAAAGTRFRLARACGFTQAANNRLNNQNSTVTITGITRSGSTATYTTEKAHNMLAGHVFAESITGADQPEYNIAATVLTVPTTTTFTATVSGTPTTPATTADKIRFFESMIFVEEYASTEFTPAVDAAPYCAYTSAVNRQHRLDRDGMEGYSFSDVHYEGTVASAHGCFYFYNLNKDSFFFDNLIIDGYRIAIDVNTLTDIHTNIHLTNSEVKNCWSQGWLGGMNGGLIDNNTFTNNGHNITGGDATLHNVYINSAANVIISNNVLFQSAMNAGLATGTSLVIHKTSSNLTIEDNLIYEALGGAGGGAYGIAVNEGHGDPETFTDCIIRRNIVKNVGNQCIVLSSNVRGIVENNIIIQNQTGFNNIACIAVQVGGAGDAANLDNIIRNNSIYGNNLGTALLITEGTGHTVVSNVAHYSGTGVFNMLNTGALSITDTTNFDVIDNNQAYAPSASAFNWESGVTGNLAAWTTASIFDDNSAYGDPLFTDAANDDLTIGASSPCVDNGHLTLSSTNDYLSVVRDASPDIGAYEYDTGGAPVSGVAVFQNISLGISVGL